MGMIFSHVYMLPWKAAARKAEKVAGKRLVALALRKAGSRIAGKLLTGSKEWTKAFEHIAEHFSEEALQHKISHSVFRATLRSRSLLEPLLKDAVLKPSRKVVSQLRLHGVSLGRVCVIIEREFADVIGEDITHTAEGVVRRPAKILRVVVDITGRPITAFPVLEFLPAGG